MQLVSNLKDSKRRKPVDRDQAYAAGISDKCAENKVDPTYLVSLLELLELAV